jgi:hypothetical protein
MWRAGNGPVWEFESLTIDDTPALRKALVDTELIRKKGLRLIPWPRKIVAKQQDFVVSKHTRILVGPKASDDDLFAAGLLRDEIRRIGGFDPAVVRRAKATAADMVLSATEGAGGDDQSYQLRTDGTFRATAKSSTGLFYAVQTAIQLLRKQSGRVVAQGAVIDDRPDLRYRMAQYDVARYQTVSLPYIKRLVREMGRFKLNQLMLYMEDDFKYSKYPFTGKPGTLRPNRRANWWHTRGNTMWRLCRSWRRWGMAPRCYPIPSLRTSERTVIPGTSIRRTRGRGRCSMIW